MRILFVMRYPLDEDYHLKMKFNGQMQAFVNMGFQVDYLAYTKDSFYLIRFNSSKKQLLGKTHFGSLRKYRNTFAFLDLYNHLCRLAKNNSYDYMYMRSKLVTGKAIKAFTEFKERGSRLIVEIPSYGSTEANVSSFYTIVQKAMKPWSKKFSALVDLYALIGLDGGGEYQCRPAINIRNGISIDQVPCRLPQSNQNNTIHILALATMRIWHAYDRLIEGIAQYQGKYDFIVDMVGKDADGSLQAWIELAKNKGISDRVVSHGPMYGDELTEMFDKCEIAVATLGFHRNSLTCGSTLKIREYTARGIPFIYGYRDESLVGDEFFALRVPANDEPLDMYEIEKWIDEICQIPDLSDRMRGYAQKKMSWESQFEKVISYFEKLKESD